METSRKFFICLTLSLLTVVALSGALEAQSFKWWKDERIVRELALTPDQSSRIDGILQEAQPTLRAKKRALDKLEDELSGMIHDAKVEEPELEQFIDRVEAARAELSKSRTLMLVRMRRVLNEQQSDKLHSLFEKEREHNRSSGRNRKQP
jgi:Spy/CpxP family protein refolding chaperone